MVKCDKCGVTAEFEEAFIKRRRSFRRSSRTWCPSCWQRKQSRSLLWTYGYYAALALLGLLLYLRNSADWFGPFLIQLLVLQLCVLLTIIPHELGHAWAGRLLGWRVFRIVVGIGKTVAKTRLAGFAFEWKSLPVGGITLTAPVQLEWLRTKLFLLVLAGLSVNAFLAAAMLAFYPWKQSPTFNLDSLPMLPKLFMLANLWVIVANLWPKTWKQFSLPVPSDGKQLLQAFFLKKSALQERHAAYFTMEALEAFHTKDHARAQQWVQAGLKKYPEDFNLLNTRGILALQRNDPKEARETFLHLLNRNPKPGAMRYVFLNNIAYADAVIGAPELLDEADRFSVEALRGLPWLSFFIGTRGSVLIRRGELEEGIKLLEKALNESESMHGKAENACFLSIGESKRGNRERAEHFLALARSVYADCYLIEQAEEALRTSGSFSKHQ